MGEAGKGREMPKGGEGGDGTTHTHRHGRAGKEETCPWMMGGGGGGRDTPTDTGGWEGRDTHPIDAEWAWVVETHPWRQDRRGKIHAHRYGGLQGKTHTHGNQIRHTHRLGEEGAAGGMPTHRHMRRNMPTDMGGRGEDTPMDTGERPTNTGRSGEDTCLQTRGGTEKTHAHRHRGRHTPTDTVGRGGRQTHVERGGTAGETPTHRGVGTATYGHGRSWGKHQPMGTLEQGGGRQ